MDRLPSDADGRTDGLPEVLFLDDLAKLLRCSPSTIKRRLRARVFPVARLPGIDKRHRWSKAALLERLALGGSGAAVRGAGGGPQERGGGRQRGDAGETGRPGVARRGTGGRGSSVRLSVVLAGGGGVLA